MDALIAQLVDLAGSDAVERNGGAPAFAIDGRTPACVVFPSNAEVLCRCLAAAHAAGAAVIPVGNGTQLSLGAPPERYDVALCTRRMARIVAHEPADMTVTAEAGVTLAELNLTLAAAAQRLPVDAPRPGHATIGGVIATNASGPLRLSNGTIRDLLIGVKAVLSDGTLINGGGRVVKNVAGYDLMKLFTGSLGTLGVIAEATFKLRPYPAHEAVLIAPAADLQSAFLLARRIFDSAVGPLFLEVVTTAAARVLHLAGDTPVVVVGCGSSVEEIAAAQAQIETLSPAGLRVCDGQDAARVTVALRDFPATMALDPAVYGCCISVLPSHLLDVVAHSERVIAAADGEALVLAHAGNGIAVVRVRGVAGEVWTGMGAAIRAFVEGLNGHVVFDALPAALKSQLDVWGAVPGLALMRRIKTTMDPTRTLSPGRFVGGI